MTFMALLFRNLRYHWRGNLAVFLGVALGTAVLTGALFVGDSLRGSLKELTLDQLGWVEQTLTPGRFFRTRLGVEVAGEPVIMLQASAARVDAAGKSAKSASKVNLLGVDVSFWSTSKLAGFLEHHFGSDLFVNETLARELGVNVGETVSFNVQKNDAVPRETLLGKRDDVVQAITFTVKAILPDEGMARFTLRPSPEPVLNAFVPLSFLQEQLNLPGKANAILARNDRGDLNAKLKNALTLEDWNLKLRTPADRAKSLVQFLDPRNKDGSLRRKLWEGRVPDALAKEADADGNLALAKITAFYERERPYTILESGQLFLDAPTEDAARAAAAKLGVAEAITPLIYLADSIADEKAEMPYAVVAAVEPKAVPNAGWSILKDDEIALVTWPGMPLAAKVGDPVTVTYYFPDERNHLQKKSATFRVGMLIPLEGFADDPDWTPEFPGVTDKLKIADWENPPFPYNPMRVKPIDEQFWKRYRATPKAYVTLAAGQTLWASRFGKVTSVRVPTSTKRFGDELLKQLRPESGGFVFQDVRAQALRASAGSSDFGMLFLGFSFFLIAAALLLVGLLFRLNMDRRASEMGLLLATGWSHRQVRGLLLAEGTILTAIGAAAGLAGALGYASAMLDFLAASWPGGSRLSFLRLHAGPLSFAIGYVASLAVSVLTIVWATRVLGKLAPRALLAGETTANVSVQQASASKPSWWRRVSSGIVIVVALIGAAASLAAGFFVTDHEAKAGSFFGAGALFLTAALALAWRWLKSGGGRSDPQPSLTLLGARNAGRHAVRSVLTVGLLASATFLIVAVEAFHKESGRDFLDRHAGSGGFTLIAETQVPVFQDLNDPKTQALWNVSKEQAALLKSATFYACRIRQGDDASCLNLYQPQKPRVLGVPAKLQQEGRYRFAASLAKTDEQKKNPWLLLNEKPDDGTIPAVVDANSAQWILKDENNRELKLGGILALADDNGNVARLRIVGLLQESIFQSEVLISEESFLRVFPRHEGFQYFLIETPPQEAKAVAEALQVALADQGVQVQTTTARLESFFAVENMYLDTFKALGGLGLLLGAAGLAIVLLRGVWERRGELALLRALGFRSSQLAWLVLAENALLLVLGLAAGTMSALLAVAPHLAGSGSGVLWIRLLALLGLVVAVGLVSGLAAVWGSMWTPLLQAMRRE